MTYSEGYNVTGPNPTHDLARSQSGKTGLEQRISLILIHHPGLLLCGLLPCDFEQLLMVSAPPFSYPLEHTHCLNSDSMR